MENKQPIHEALVSPEFDAIWGVIKGWYIERIKGEGSKWATGTDVMIILNALKELEIKEKPSE